MIEIDLHYEDNYSDASALADGQYLLIDRISRYGRVKTYPQSLIEEGEAWIEKLDKWDEDHQ